MKIVNLIENTKGREGCVWEHGLSFYIETEKHRLLMDTGASGAFLTNADRLGIDLSRVDTVVLSHGHYDHTGGVTEFVKRNPRARILAHSKAAGEYYHVNDAMVKYIGMSPETAGLSQMEYIDGELEIDEELFLFGNVKGRRLWPEGNRELKKKEPEGFCQDEFCHEQYLVISTEGKKILMSGCAHNGILNILDRYRELFGMDPDMAISGFHMQKKSGYTEEDLEMVRQTALELKKTHILFYTGHCTGERPYEILKEVMGGQIRYVHSGDAILSQSISSYF